MRSLRKLEPIDWLLIVIIVGCGAILGYLGVKG